MLILLAIASLKVALGVLAVAALFATGQAGRPGTPLWVFPVHMAAFAIAAALLVRGGREDRRATCLGALLLLIGASFSTTPIGLVEQRLWPSAALRLIAIRLDALQPLLLWLFFSKFPRALPSRRARRISRPAIWTSATIGVALIVANAAVVLGSSDAALVRIADGSSPRALYWWFVYGLALPAIPYAFWRMRNAPAEERRRATVFAAGLGGALALFSLVGFAQLASPALLEWSLGPGQAIVMSFTHLVILSVPLTTAYAVLVDRALPLGVLVRGALQYGMARSVVAAAVALPLVWLAVYLFSLRDEPLVELASAPRLLLLASAGGLAIGAFRARHRARDAIDRAFFREQYDARRTLLGLAERSRQVGRAGELAGLLASEIDQALHVERIAVLIVEPLSGELRASAGSLRPLPTDSALAKRLAEANAPLPVGLEHGDGPLAALPEDERHWLADAGARLLVPITSSRSELIGLVVLGEKRSELSFTAEDRELLAAIAAAGAVTLESRLRLGTRPFGQAESGEARDVAASAWQCSACGCVQAQGSGACAECSGVLAAIALPLVLNGKFRLERRVGEGAMGAVYRARDLELDRVVAIKTLPGTSPADAERLRREARAMAAVRHPNLAVVFAAESWRGMPLLVTEFLDGGTLADRILPARLLLAEVIELGTVLAGALERLHRAGILHRDIKPSNIGFTAEGEPRLLDFGLARVLDETRAPALVPPMADEPVGRRTTRTEEGLAGTPLYMSPEALAGETPDPSFDLWSLAVVLYEALSGRNPFERATWRETLEAIRCAEPPDLRGLVPEVPPAVAAFFPDALQPSLRRRPGSAAELRNRWQAATRA